MSLIRLKATHFRNLAPLHLEPEARFNLIHGVNGSGKTSILEAIYFLGMGRSFRSSLATRAIAHQEDSFSLFGSVKITEQMDIPIGVEKQRSGKATFRLANEPLTSAAELAKTLPLLLINPNSYQLLTEGPKQRRQFLDWLLFHVEPQFFSVWQRFYRVLKQRNAALQQKTGRVHVSIWNPEFLSLAASLTEMRRRMVDKLRPHVTSVMAELAEEMCIDMAFHQGWSEDKDLMEQLETSFSRDSALGYTHLGPQRADIDLKLNRVPVRDVLSRGEQKILVFSLFLAQGRLLLEEANRKCIYLLDDLTAELDPNRQQKTLDVLSSIEAQVFITAVEPSFFKKAELPSKMFHVEQGMVIEE